MTLGKKLNQSRPYQRGRGTTIQLFLLPTRLSPLHNRSRNQSDPLISKYETLLLTPGARLLSHVPSFQRMQHPVSVSLSKENTNGQVTFHQGVRYLFFLSFFFFKSQLKSVNVHLWGKGTQEHPGLASGLCCTLQTRKMHSI